MGDYTPVYKPGQAVTFTATAAVTGGQHVAVSGDMSVAPAAAGSAMCVGQAGHDAASGERVTVHLPGRPVHEATAGGTIAAGAGVKVGATAATVVAFVEGTDDEPARIGTALTGASADETCRYLTA